MQDDDELSYAVKPLGNHLFPTHALCIGCNEVKPIKHFKTMSTNAQAKAWGFKKAIEITSGRCDKCRPPKKKVLSLSLNEIRNKITVGDIRPYIGEAMLKEMREQLPKKRSRIMKEHWQKKRGEPIAQLQDKIQKQVAKYGNRYHAYKANPQAQHALLEQHRQNYESARQVRDEVFKQLKSGEITPNEVDVVSLFTRRKL